MQPSIKNCIILHRKKSLLQISVKSAEVLTAYHSIEFVPGDVENDSVIHKSVQKDTSVQLEIQMNTTIHFI